MHRLHLDDFGMIRVASPYDIPGRVGSGFPMSSWWRGMISSRVVMPKMWRTAELAEALSTSPERVRRMAKSGQIPSIRLNGSGRGRFYFDWPAVRRALRHQGPGSID